MITFTQVDILVLVYWTRRMVLMVSSKFKLSSTLLFIHSKQTKAAFTQEPRIWLNVPPLWQTWSIRDCVEGKVRHRDVAFQCSQPWEHQSCTTKGIKIIRNSEGINGASDVEAQHWYVRFSAGQEHKHSTSPVTRKKKQHPETTLEHFFSFGCPLSLFLPPSLSVYPLLTLYEKQESYTVWKEKAVFQRDVFVCTLASQMHFGSQAY